MRKNYQILLCESFYEDGTFIEKPVCEVGSSTSTFSGQAFNIEFYTKIDGTHELTFNLPRYYYDEYTGKRVKNGLVELIVNKSRLELTKVKRDGETQTFYLVVNNRKDKEEKGVFSYEYSCGDAYIEELAKNGYGVVFDDDVEGNGLGDIHHFSREIAKDSGWEYDEEKTGKLPEYKTETEWNVSQMRNEEIKTLVPVPEIEYVPELERYCYKLNYYKKKYYNNLARMHQVYCYDDSKTIASSAVKNLLYNGDDFTDTIGWKSFYLNGKEYNENATLSSVQIKNEDKTYYDMKISGGTANTTTLFNDTSASANQHISADLPYLFSYNGTGGKITQIQIYNKNPISNKDATADYTWKLENGFETDKLYVIKTKTSFSTPYFVFTWEYADSSKTASIHSIRFFELMGINQDKHIELLRDYGNGKIMTNAEDLKSITYPDDFAFSAYTEHKVQYFIRDNWVYSFNGNYEKEDYIDLGLEEKTVTYLDFKNEINNIETATKKGDAYNFTLENGVFEIYKAKTIKIVNTLPEKDIDVNLIYEKDGKYYQYYKVTDDTGRGYLDGAAWDYALLGACNNGKRRTYHNSKSNRFNLIQDIAELFKVWPVFETSKNEDGTISKKFYFKEEALQENFSGFHRGVNLAKLVRTIDSDEVVTKMYVEDQESDYAQDGFVTIRTSKYNPWGENYLYNFQYYTDQELMNVTQDGVPLVEKKLKVLYTSVGKLNTLIRELNEQNVEINSQIRNLQNREKVLTLQCASAQERVASAEGDLDNTDKMSNADKEILQSNISRWKAEMEQWENELSRVEEQLVIAEASFEENSQKIKNYQDGQWEEDDRTYYGKEKLIHDFEAEFLPYIKEGVWLDNSYVDNDTYFLDAQKVLMTSSKPKLEWTIEVVDGSMATELEDFEFEVGDKTILVDNEFFGVEKNGEKNYVFEVLISGIKEGLDNATKNTIEVRNYNTSFEELFERISAATQTLELNEQTYNKSQYFTSDGELDADILQKTLLQNSLILANAADNSYVLDETGLSFQSLLNPNKKVRLLAEGLFLSNETDLKTGAPKWATGITANGISASLLTAGEINTANIKIFSDAQPSQSWNKLGITSYRLDSNGKIDNTTFVRLDQFGLYLIEGKDNVNWQLDGEGNAWFETLPRDKAIEQIRNNATVSITEAGFDFNYTPEIDEEGINGRIQLGNLGSSFGLLIEQGGETCVRLDNEGNNEIAGWKISKGLLKSFEGTDDCNNFYISTNPDHGYWIKAQDMNNSCIFGVTKAGILKAKGADIEGVLTTETSNGHKLTLTSRYTISDNDYYPALVFSDGDTTMGTSLSANWKNKYYHYYLDCHTGSGKGKFRPLFSINKAGSIYFNQICLQAGEDNGLFFIGKEETDGSYTGIKLYRDTAGYLRYGESYFPPFFSAAPAANKVCHLVTGGMSYTSQGSFTSQEGWTVTVKDGIITSIS